MTLAVPLEYAAIKVSASGRKGARRWEIYRGGIYLGDIAHRPDDDVWDWIPEEGDPVTVNTADDAIRAMLGTFA